MRAHPYFPAVSSQNRSAFTIALLYVLIGSLWIVFSDQLAAQIAPNQAALTAISIYKGWGYVLVTGFMLYWLIRRDSTERKQTEEALRKSQVQLRSFIEQAPLSIAMFDRNMNYLAASQRWVAEYGRGYTDLIGHNHYEIHPDVPDYWKDVHQKGLAGIAMKNDDDLWTQADGSRHWLRWAVNPWTKENGEVGGIIISAEDITKRKQAEEALYRSEERLNGIITSAMDAIISIDAEQRIMLFNPAAEVMFQCEQAEALGQPVEHFLPQRFRPGHTQHIQKFAQTGVSSRAMGKLGTIYGLRRNGEEFPIEASISQTLVEGKSIFTVILRDVTEREHAEDELKRSNTELEQFAYVASHDLQEPLRAVAGMVQLLGQRYKGRLDERADEYIGHAVEASTRMQSLINDLLDYSRVDRHGRPFSPTNMERTLDNALANLQVSILESGTQITRDPLPTVMADASQLTQVFQNLIGNAIKFQGIRPPEIHVNAEKMENGWRFAILDNGIGIESKYFERIFLVFQRLHTRREYSGTGIGLSLCKKIVERHHGQIWVESELEKGSTFYFTILER